MRNGWVGLIRSWRERSIFPLSRSLIFPCCSFGRLGLRCCRDRKRFVSHVLELARTGSPRFDDFVCLSGGGRHDSVGHFGSGTKAGSQSDCANGAGGTRRSRALGDGWNGVGGVAGVFPQRISWRDAGRPDAGVFAGCRGCCSGLRGVVGCQRGDRKDVVGSSLLVHPHADCFTTRVAAVASGFPNRGLAVAPLGGGGINRTDVGCGGDAKADCGSALDATVACVDECCCCFVASDAGHHGDA